jgi:alpha-tubulin suppressor-like RCC1 family protein
MKGSFFFKKAVGVFAGVSMVSYYAYNQRLATMWADNGNRVYAWGAGMNGQLGLGQEVFSVDVPTEVEELSDKNIIYIHAWGDISAALSEEGDIYLFGKTKGGALGAGGKAFTTNLTLPTKFEFNDLKFKHVSCGKNHVAAITVDGRVLTWGNPDNGKLGHGEMTTNKEYKPKNYADRAEIDFVGGDLQDKEVVSVEWGFNSTVALTKEGDVYTWGFGHEGALGHGDYEDCYLPTKIDSLSNIKKIYCGGDFTMCLDNEGNLYSFGKNPYGQLGITGLNAYKECNPSKVVLSKLAVPSTFSWGEDHCAMVTEAGTVWTWGYGNDGQLGHDNKNSLNTPKHVKGFENAVEVNWGGGHTGFTLDNGELYMFGRGRDGQLGRGDVVESMAAYRTTPLKVEYLVNNDLKVSKLALGSNHSIALVSVGK